MLAVYKQCSAGWVRVALVMQKPDPELISADSEGHPWHCWMEVGGITWQCWGVTGGGINPLLLSLPSVSTCMMLCGHATLN